MVMDQRIKKFKNEKISRLSKKAIKVEIAKNGPNGISLLIVNFLLTKINNKIDIIAPIQNEKMKAVAESQIPKRNPHPRASLPSPRPISRPPERQCKSKKGKLIAMPEKSTKKKLPKEKTPNIKEVVIKIQTILFGIILCLMS